MRRTLSSLRALERDLQRLEQTAEGRGELSGREQVLLLQDALYGDRVAAEKFEAAHAAGKIHAFLFRLFELERTGPCTGTGCNTCLTHRKGAN